MFVVISIFDALLYGSQAPLAIVVDERNWRVSACAGGYEVRLHIANGYLRADPMAPLVQRKSRQSQFEAARRPDVFDRRVYLDGIANAERALCGGRLQRQIERRAGECLRCQRLRRTASAPIRCHAGF